MSKKIKKYNDKDIWDAEFWDKYLLHRARPSKMPTSYNAFPKDCKFAYMTSGYYVTGFRFLNLLRDETETDLKELKKLLFVEDPKQSHKWGILRSRIPFPEGRITDLPGTRTLHYNNYCLRNLTPESASSWRKSIQKFEKEKIEEENVCLDPELDKEINH